MKATRHWTGAAAAMTLLSWAGTNSAVAEAPKSPTQSESPIALYYSDGSSPDFGMESINRRLQEIGVRVTRVPIPAEAKPILKKSAHKALSRDESKKLIRHFHLGRRELLDEIGAAGRKPAVRQGGHLQTSEVGVAPYPKVYDMQALDPRSVVHLQRKFGRLHVNSSETGIGIDEVMTIVSGGPYTWFFGFDGDVVGKLRFTRIQDNGKAWRISYPGLVPHGGYFDAADGLVVAYAHGPRYFVMRYAGPAIHGRQILGDNPWIDFSGDRPSLREHSPKSAN